MKKYVAVLGRQPEISLAELESLFRDVKKISPQLAEFELVDAADTEFFDRLGGTQKIGYELDQPVDQYLKSLEPDGKITLGVSDFSRGATAYKTQGIALKLKRILAKAGHSVRVVPNKTAALSSAVSFHNHLYTDSKIELIKNGKKYYRVVQVQNINAYVQRDQARPARDAKVGMLPPKLAQILINLCGRLPRESRILDPFCGTGVVLQEAALMGYNPYGTDINERMVEYSEKNLKWLYDKHEGLKSNKYEVTAGDATSYQWTAPISAVACETYLGPPMSLAPAEIKLRQAKQECKGIIIGFLKNLAGQITTGTPVVIAVPAWLRPDGRYEHLNILDEIDNLRYNVVRFKNLGQKELLYHRDGQVVAREIIVLRKK